MIKLRYLSDIAVRAIALARRARPARRVLALHDTPDRDALREKLQFLTEHTTVVPLDSLWRAPVSDRAVVALTFDDGYASWHEIAAPLLTEFKVPATFFVCSGFVGLTGSHADEFVRKRLGRLGSRLVPLSRQALGELARTPHFSIGSHTTHHPSLGGPLSAEELHREIEGDRARLQEWTGGSVDTFAYPFGTAGSAHPSIREAVRSFGFSSAYSLVPGPLTPMTDRYFAPRLGLALDSSPATWRASIGGAYDIYYRARMGVGERISL